VRVLIVFYFLFIGVVALLAQMILPAHFTILSATGFGSALIPLLVIYASLELADERAPILAGFLGLLVDLNSNQNHRLGVTVLILMSLSALIVTQASKPESHQWIFRLTFVLVGTFIFFLLDYFFTLVEAGLWYWPLAVWSKITFASLLNLIMAPLFFLMVGFLPRQCGWKPTFELKERLRTRAYL
jgi:cell shape-determining protein MreD